MSQLIKAGMAAVLAATTLPAAAQAATLVVDVAGITTNGEFLDSGNTVLTFNLGAGSTVTDFAYDFNVTAFSPSWLSEIQIYFTDSAVFDGVVVTPGLGDDLPGTATYTGGFNLADVGLSFDLGTDGVLRLEFAEGFGDGSVNPDGVFNSGSLTFTYTTLAGGVPEPATWGLMILGFGAVGVAMRRRVRTSVRYA